MKKTILEALNESTSKLDSIFDKVAEDNFGDEIDDKLEEIEEKDIDDIEVDNEMLEETLKNYMKEVLHKNIRSLKITETKMNNNSLEVKTLIEMKSKRKIKNNLIFENFCQRDSGKIIFKFNNNSFTEDFRSKNNYFLQCSLHNNKLYCEEFYVDPSIYDNKELLNESKEENIDIVEQMNSKKYNYMIADYIKYKNLDLNDTIDEKNIDDYAVAKIACEYNCAFDTFRNVLLSRTKGE